MISNNKNINFVFKSKRKDLLKEKMFEKVFFSSFIFGPITNKLTEKFNIFTFSCLF